MALGGAEMFDWRTFCELDKWNIGNKIKRVGFVPPDVGFVPTDVGCTPVLLPRSSRLESLWSEQKELKVKGLESLWSEQKGAMCCAHQEE